VACRPQAWDAGTTILSLEMFLGIYPDVRWGRGIVDPALPAWLGQVCVANLHSGLATLNLRFSRQGEHSTVQMVSQVGKLDGMI
jgi:hypothetical protein